MSSINDDWFIIKDLDGLINSARALVFNNFGDTNKTDPEIISMAIAPEDQEELDKILSFDESKIIVNGLIKKQKNKVTSSIRYMINDAIFEQVILSLNDRMVSNLLNSLVNKGMVETAYDNETNDFVFWIKDENKKEKRKTD